MLPGLEQLEDEDADVVDIADTLHEQAYILV